MKIVNIFSDFRKIYTFCRTDEGELEVNSSETFFPYYYAPDPNGDCRSYKGEPLRKLIVSNPKDISQNRGFDSYEADIFFVKRYLIDKVDAIEKTKVKYCFIDIEVMADELPDVQEAKYPISCISVYNSYTDTTESFYLDDEQTEFEMIGKFIDYMKEEKFDIWFSWNVKFDYNYLFHRFPDFAESISIIGKSRYGDGEVFYPAGISIIDYLAWFKKVTFGKERSYALDAIAQKHLGEEPYEKVDFSIFDETILDKNRNDVLRMAKLEAKFKLVTYFDNIRRLSKVEWEDMIWNSRVIDMLLLQEAHDQKVALPMRPKDLEKEDFGGAFREAFQTGAFFKCSDYDLSSCYPSMIIDFCLDPANVKDTGLPIQIKTEVRKEKKFVFNEDGSIKRVNAELIRFDQNPSALLTTVVKKLMTLKSNIKHKLSTLELDTEEYKDEKINYNAIKSLVNSSYGVFGNRFFRLYDKRVASATTFLVRDLLHYVIAKVKEKGYEIVYVDTDGIMIKDNEEDISEMLNGFVKDWAKEKYNKENITTEFEHKGCYTKILILAKCRYFGYIETSKGIEEQIKGVEAKRKDSTIFMKKFQKELIIKILDKEPKKKIFAWIKDQVKKVKTTPLHEIAFPCKLGRKPEAYKNVPVFLKALNNTKDYSKKVGEPFYYIYVKPEKYEMKTVEQTVVQTYNKKGEIQGFKKMTLNRVNKALTFANVDLRRKKDGEEMDEDERIDKLIDLKLCKIKTVEVKGKAMDAMAFDETESSHIDKKKVDWKRIIERNITMKLVTIFEAMKWDIKEVL